MFVNIDENVGLRTICCLRLCILYQRLRRRGPGTPGKLWTHWLEVLLFRFWFNWSLRISAVTPRIFIVSLTLIEGLSIDFDWSRFNRPDLTSLTTCFLDLMAAFKLAIAFCPVLLFVSLFWSEVWSSDIFPLIANALFSELSIAILYFKPCCVNFRVSFGSFVGNGLPSEGGKKNILESYSERAIIFDERKKLTRAKKVGILCSKSL